MKKVTFSKLFTALFLSSSFLVATSCADSEDQLVTPAAPEGKANMQAKDQGSSMMKEFWTEINPLNHSGVMGHAKLMVAGNVLTVEIWAEGLAPDELHPQHIHGFVDNKGNAVCPPPTADTDGDGLVELSEGAPFYGPVLLSLTPFPMASGGTIHYKQSFILGMDEVIAYANLKPLQNRVIVLHGAYVKDGMVVPKGTADAEYMATLPVACGQITPDNGNKTGR